MDLFVSRTRFTPREGYRITRGFVRAVPRVSQARRDLGMPFFERLMLAVTEVNGCALCSYGHAQAALESGLSRAEVRALLGGDTSGVPEAEGPAVLFAQHFAQSRGLPSPQAWTHVEQVYGRHRAAAILTSVRTILWGNAYGIPLTSLLSRLRGEPHPGSSLRYELTMLTSQVPFLPVAVLDVATERLRHTPVRRIAASRRPEAGRHGAVPAPETRARTLHRAA